MMKLSNNIRQEHVVICEPARPPPVRVATEASESFCTTSTVVTPAVPSFDIEHTPVENDPHDWSSLRKNLILFLTAFAAMVAALAANIQNPAVDQMEIQLPATPAQLSLSISIFMLVQGLMPFMWTSISEIKGRKLAYIISLGLFTLGSTVVALSQHIASIIGFRCLQAVGSSALMPLGAASLADIFEPEERGRKMGVYNVAFLLGQALGPIFGGVLTTLWGWSAIFWLLATLSGSCLIAFVLLFHDTFRPERSLTYQNVLKQRSDDARPINPDTSTRKIKVSLTVGRGCIQTDKLNANVDIEKTVIQAKPLTSVNKVPKITLTLKDVNPFKPMYLVLRRPNNVLILFSSGVFFAFVFQLAYTTSRRLGDTYGYDSLKIGLVSMSYGAGSILGSIFGGKWSDRMRKIDVGRRYTETRLKSTFAGLVLLPIIVLGFGWLCDKIHDVIEIAFFQFFRGFLYLYIYSSLLAYLVDANVGRSSTAVAADSAFRGTFAFIATEFSVPLQDGVGDGWMYTIWTGILMFSSAVVVLVWLKGTKWRENAETRDATFQPEIKQIL